MLAVVHAGDDAFGMGVRREIETRTGRDVAIGAVYATLDRLEAVSASFPVAVAAHVRPVAPNFPRDGNWNPRAGRNARHA